jgi:hypothetical protein
VLVSDELQRRADRLLERRTRRADFRDADKSLDNFDFDFNKKMNRRTIYELAAGHFIAKHEDALFLGPPGTGKSHTCSSAAAGSTTCRPASTAAVVGSARYVEENHHGPTTVTGPNRRRHHGRVAPVGLQGGISRAGRHGP